MGAAATRDDLHKDVLAAIARVRTALYGLDGCVRRAGGTKADMRRVEASE